VQCHTWEEKEKVAPDFKDPIVDEIRVIMYKTSIYEGTNVATSFAKVSMYSMRL
jgi:hypothetical protein